jgi:hypothetical protein
MSSYLSIYIVPKRKSDKEEKKHIIVAAFSSSSEVYQYFSDNINPAYIGNKEHPYTTITKENIGEVITDISRDLNSSKNMLIEYEKYAKDNSTFIHNIIELKQHISNLQYTQGKITFIEDMVDNIDFYNDIEEVCCNID